MRISDWSSDVCSSDLFAQGAVVKNDIRRHARFQRQFPAAGAQGVEQRIADRIGRRLPFAAPLPLWRQHHRNRLLPAQDRSGIGTKLQATMLIRLQRIAKKKGAGHWLEQRAFFSTNDAKDRKPIMPPLLHLFISGADQHCLNMTNRKSLASTINRGRSKESRVG